MTTVDNRKVSLVGKTVVVTGANQGIGYETALECARRGARVILACRNETRGEEAVEKIQKTTQNEDVAFKLLDLASLTSVNHFAREIMDSEKRLDILVNNAGAIFLGNQLSEDGFQLQMQINYIGPVLLTLLLLDLIKKSAPSRIINIASDSAKYAKNFAPETMNDYSGHFTAYANTKLGNIFFTQELAKKLKDANVSVFSVQPGAVNTDITWQHFNRFLRACGKWFTRIFFKTPAQGSVTGLYAALEPGIEELTGSHFEECEVVTYKKAKNPEKAKEIWDYTMEILKYDDKNI